MVRVKVKGACSRIGTHYGNMAETRRGKQEKPEVFIPLGEDRENGIKMTGNDRVKSKMRVL